MLYRADSLAKRKLSGAGVHVRDLMDVSRSAKASSIGVGRGVIERSLAPRGLRGDVGGVEKTEKEPVLCGQKQE